jgi:hypothetical protein
VIPVIVDEINRHRHSLAVKADAFLIGRLIDGPT